MPQSGAFRTSSGFISQLYRFRALAALLIILGAAFAGVFTPVQGQGMDSRCGQCPRGQVCDYSRAQCITPPPAPSGHYRCPDGILTCPNGTTCNSAGVGTDRCLTPGSTRCGYGDRAFWCGPGKTCDLQRMQCTDRATARGGEKVCEDGLTVCPSGYQCNVGGVGRDKCLAPGSTSCRGSGGVEFWCGPKQTCNYQRGMCVDRATARGGEKVCEDGLTVCPRNYQCNVNGVGRDKCLAPGSTQCGYGERTFWCGPTQTCDYQRMMCVNKVQVPPGYFLCSDGMLACPRGTTCNPQGIGNDRCLQPGSTACGYVNRGNGYQQFWCGPTQTCDYQRNMCVNKQQTAPSLPQQQPQQQQQQSTPQQPADYGPVGEWFCCEWNSNPNARTCMPMQQVARCTAQPNGAAKFNHYCHAFTYRCTPNGQ